jgi:AmpD protein
MSADVRPGELGNVELPSGLLLGARYVPSPNCDDRPPGVLPELIVVHGISLPPGEFGGPWIERLFTNQLDTAAHPFFATIARLRVSAHVLIPRKGDCVQFVPFQRRAWHAGVSRWRGRGACNDFSIGIELEGCDDRPYVDPQYTRLVAVCEALMKAYPTLSRSAIAGHSEIAPGRKTDPGPAFDWPHFRDLLGQRAATTGDRRT